MCDYTPFQNFAIGMIFLGAGVVILATGIFLLGMAIAACQDLL